MGVRWLEGSRHRPLEEYSLLAAAVRSCNLGESEGLALRHLGLGTHAAVSKAHWVRLVVEDNRVDLAGDCKQHPPVGSQRPVVARWAAGRMVAQHMDPDHTILVELPRVLK